MARREDECAGARKAKGLRNWACPGYKLPPTPSVEAVDIDKLISQLLRQ